MTDLIIVIILLGLIGAAVTYIVKAKKRGVKCIGCPSGSQCPHKCSGCGSGNKEGGCHCHE